MTQNLSKILRILAVTAAVLLALSACKKEPKAVAVTGINLDPTTLSLAAGETGTLAATVSPAYATNQKIIWSTDNASVATVSDGIVTGVAAGSATITAASDDGGFTATCPVTVFTVPVTGISIEPSNLFLSVGDEITVNAVITPSNATDKSVHWAAYDKSVIDFSGEGGGLSIGFKAVGLGTTAIVVYALGGQGLIKAECEVTVKKSAPAGAVDLGLDVYWAECNLSDSGLCASPEIIGDYYAFGEVSTRPSYSSSSYKLWNPDNDYKVKKYCPAGETNKWDGQGEPDNKLLLDPEDDAASVILKGKWRMPTYEEMNDLKNKCTWSWTTRNGVNGCLLTGPSGNSIFLPAGGYKSISTNYCGMDCVYRSSSINTGDPARAGILYCSSESISCSNKYSRSYGCTIRPVTD